MAFLGLLKRKNTWVISWQGWLLITLMISTGLTWTVRNIHPFLAINHPVSTDILVVEGWMPDTALEQAAREFTRQDYKLLVTTGGPLPKGFYLSEFSTYAELTAATFTELGIRPQRIVAVPAPPVRTDRTFASALALARWTATQVIQPDSLNIYTLDTHARRTRLLFQRALGDQISVGVLSAPHPEYDGDNWWTVSSGMRSIISEGIAYLYARWLFKPAAE